jgi:hypothetical protein
VSPEARKPKQVLPSNAISLTKWNMEQLKKTADSRGIPLAKLVAQMVQEYLREDQESAAGPKPGGPSQKA